MDFSVDRDFVRVGDKSYAINKINSVEVRTTTQKGSRAYIAFWIIAGLFALGVLGALASGEGAFGMFVFAGICGFLGWLSYRKRADTNTYALLLVTSSGEATAVTTTDRGQIASIRREIEGAISAR